MNPHGHHAMNGYRANNLASTSSRDYNDFPPHNANHSRYHNTAQHQRQSQHPPQSMQQRNHPNQWSQHAMQMNGQLNGSQMDSPQMNGLQLNNRPTPPLPPAHPQQNQVPFGQQAWPNPMLGQLGSQGFAPGAAPAAFNMSFLPQQILQDAYAMSTPVEAADEPFLLTKLLASRRKGESYKDALNSIHGKNGHSASLWKDYYLDHKERLDAWIAMCLQKEKADKEKAEALNNSNKPLSDLDRAKLPTVKKPSPSTFKRETSLNTSSSSRHPLSAPPIKRAYQKQPSKSMTPIPIEHPGSRRSTINSITAPAPTYGDRLPAPNAELKVPEPPSRSPSPPTRIIVQGRGNKYTKEDRDFFIKFVGWRLKQDPDLTRSEICNMLAEKAPHHKAQSWASHWSNNHDLPDKILAAARGEEHAPEESSDEEVRAPVRRRPKYKDPSTSEESEESESESEKNDNVDDDDDEDDDEDMSVPLRKYTESQMGQKGEPFTEADFYFTAKYIAGFKNWDTALAKHKWDPYGAKFPQRSGKSWAEYFRRNEKAILKMARRIKKEDSGSSQPAPNPSTATQYGRPTRTPPKAKRKFEFDSNDENLVKKGRMSLS